MSGRPLDVLEASLGDRVHVHLKTGEEYVGELSGYDQHMNLVLQGARDASSAGSARDDPEGDGGSAQDTTIIRGDNVVSINP
ncbi:LSM domain-containing protein [Halovivax cerinus]|uniref:LSM domain-containing protein n=1 Tax=Halovivax cerinus TaxID=1487865 RepID=A0ABD5NPU0_9EURY|nr:LSM domain-containing protein [Halovivax cerinus]